MSTTGPLSWNVSQKITADTNDLAPSLGFQVNQDCTLSYKGRGDSALKTFPFKAGVEYSGDLVQVDITGSTAGTEVLILRRGAKFS